MTTDDEDTPPDAFDESTDPAAADDVLADDGFDRPYFAEPAVGVGPTDVGLVRDPTATFGGVLSGIAHRYGWDVAVTRLVAVVLVLATSGVGLIVYLLAWIIVPRAKYWPPPGTSVPRRVSGRDLAIGLIAAGALLALAIGGGDLGVVLIPLALVGGGLWLLVQGPSSDSDATPGVSSAAGATGPLQTTPRTPVETASYPAYSPAATPAPPVAPVQPRSRRRRFAIVAAIGASILALLALIAIPLALLLAFGTGNVDFTSDDPIELRPQATGDIIGTIVEDTASIILDLSLLDRADFERLEEPIAVRISVDIGSIQVIVPTDVVVSVDADVDVGSVQVFGRRSDGFRASRAVVADDPDLELNLDLNLGDIVVLRG